MFEEMPEIRRDAADIERECRNAIAEAEHWHFVGNRPPAPLDRDWVILVVTCIVAIFMCVISFIYLTGAAYVILTFSMEGIAVCGLVVAALRLWQVNDFVTRIHRNAHLRSGDSR
jgi:hypothetical protein